ncbi:YPDG domain-containing protein [Streptococcus suis]|uniref:YPDG domain-containing protein n=1 Tax=Streptococcus suis TaxID=1307 RepID=A0AAJ2UIH5_STRSU|nr:YPDG domain-containing protein [Streptococcus suis]HEL2065597.1 YPDG domain-containing protein [Streptococcus suis]HEL2621620.1 YPDG domain-containing protein [Streptococcus suis]
MERKRPKKFDWYNAKQRFSIRKYHCGAASVLLGVSLALSGGMEVSALTMDTAPSNSVAETISLSTDKTEASTDAITSTDTAATDAVSSKDVVERATKIDYTVEYQDETGTAVATVAKSIDLTTKDPIAIAVVTETAELPEGYQLAVNEVATINSGVVEGGSTKIVFKVVKQAAETASVTTSTLPIDTAISTSSAVPAEFKARAATEPATIEDVKHLLAQVSSEAAVLASQGERLVATTESNNSLLQTTVKNARLVAKESDLLLANSAATVEQLYKQINSVRTNVEALAVELRKFSPDGVITAQLGATALADPVEVLNRSSDWKYGIKSVTSQYIGKDSEGLDMVKWVITHDSKASQHYQYILVATSDKFNNTGGGDITIKSGSPNLNIYDYQDRLGYINFDGELSKYFGNRGGNAFAPNEKPSKGPGANRALFYDKSWRDVGAGDYVIEVITHGPNHTLYVRSSASRTYLDTENDLRDSSATRNVDWDDTLTRLTDEQRYGSNKIITDDGFLKGAGPIEENTPSTATNKHDIFIFNKTPIKTVDSSNKPDGLDKVKIADLVDPEGIKSVEVNQPSSLGYSVDKDGNAYGTASVDKLGYYSRGLKVTDNKDNVTDVLSNNKYMTYVLDTAVKGTVIKEDWEGVTESDILSQVEVNTGGVANVAEGKGYRKVLLKNENEDLSKLKAGTYVFTVRVVTDSNVYKDEDVTVIVKATVSTVEITDFKEGDRSVELVPKSDVDQIFVGVQGKSVKLVKKPDGTYVAEENAANVTVSTDSKTGNITLTLPDGKTFAARDRVVTRAEKKDPTELDGYVRSPEVEKFATALSDVAKAKPNYPVTNVIPGTPAISTPAFTDASGRPVAAPKNATYEIPSDFKVPEGYTAKINPTTGVVTVTVANGTTVESIEVPVKVTYEDKTVENAKAKFQLDTDGDGMPDVTDKDDDNDGISDEVEKEKGTDPKVPNVGISVTPKDVLEGKPVPDGTQVVKPESPKTAITPSAPVNGVSVDGNGNLVGTPKVDDWGKDEEEREITIPVTVTTDGESKVIDVPVTIQRDTDGDGMPDVTDKDDDNDGILDTEDPAPKDPTKPNTGVTVTPKDVLEGKPVPDGTQVVKPESPKTVITPSAPVNGVSVDGNGNLVGTPKVDDWGKDEEEREITIPVTVTTDGESKVVNVPVTIQRDTDGDGMPDVTDTDDDNDGISDEVEKEKGTDPKVPNVGISVTPKDVLEGQPVPDGTQVVKPESPKTVITPSTPVNGVSVDGDGNLVGTPKVDDWGKDEEERKITIPVTVTTDGESKVIDVPVTIQRDTDGDGMPDVTDTDDDNDGISDEVEKEKGTDPKVPNVDVSVTPKDVLEGQPVPDGTRVVKPESPKTVITPSAPVNGVSVDGNGNLVGTPKVDDWGKDEEERKITIPVTVTTDGESKVIDVPVTIQRDTDGDGVPDVTDTDDDNDGITDEVEKETGTDPKSPNTGVTVSPKDVLEGQPVPDGTQVVKPESPKTVITPSAPVNGVSVDGNGNLVGTPKVDDWGKDEEEREITIPVTVTTDGESKVIDVPVTIQRDTDGDGMPDVTDTDDDNDGISDEVEKEKGTDPKVPNAGVTVTPKDVLEGQPVPDGTQVVKPESPKTVITPSAPVNGVSVDGNGNLVGTPKVDDWGKDEEERKITIPVTVTTNGESKVIDVPVTIQRDTDGDGMPDVTDTDDDNDGISDEVEKEKGTDPKVPNAGVAVTPKSTETKSTKSTTAQLPNTGETSTVAVSALGVGMLIATLALAGKRRKKSEE